MPDEITKSDNSNACFSPLYTCSASKNITDVDLQPNGKNAETVKLLGAVPVKEIRVKSDNFETVFVSGEAFGIKLYTDGVIVIGTQGVETKNGKRINPAEEAGIETGDIIVSVNKTKVYSSLEVTEILNDNNGNPYDIRIKRDGRYRVFTLKPVYSYREGCYKAGMWVRDSTAGIGTVTFFNPKRGTFAALGHQINDVDTNELMPLLKGEAVRTNVTGVQMAKKNEAGSLLCDFENDVIGSLKENTPCGLYGKYNYISELSKPYTVAPKQEIKKGRAQIITTLSGKKPEAYEIEILRISYNKLDSGRDLVFKVTDKRLLKRTGGIVQGMSGSPIVQNNKLVGAVTHVIINSPQKGYGIFAETMLDETEKINK